MNRKAINRISHACWLADHGWQVFGYTVCRFGAKTQYRLSARTMRRLVERQYLSFDAGQHWTYRWRAGRRRTGAKAS